MYVCIYILPVLAAEGLNLQALSGSHLLSLGFLIFVLLFCSGADRRIYVSVAVGPDHKTTATSDFVNPLWNEKFVL